MRVAEGLVGCKCERHQLVEIGHGVNDEGAEHRYGWAYLVVWTQGKIVASWVEERGEERHGTTGRRAGRGAEG